MEPLTPQGTGLTRETAIYGDVRIGSSVIIQRHRPVNGDDNWAPAKMDRYVGCIGVVTALSGVDSKGCPGVRVAVDGAAVDCFFRVRDVILLSVAAQLSGVGMSAANADYGCVTVGSAVLIQRHTPVEGMDNWGPQMDQWVGKIGIVTKLSGVDSKGCPGVRVSVNGVAVQHFFRIRNCVLLTGGSRGIQDTGLTTATVRYGNVSVGNPVVITRHTPVKGADNWAQAMDQYIGRACVVKKLSGVDSQGCPGVRVLLGGVEVPHFFRLRDLIVCQPIELPQGTGMTSATINYGCVTVGSAVLIQRHTPVEGMDNWNAQMDQWVGKIGIVTKLSGVDSKGCPGVRVSVNGVAVQHFFRIRNCVLLNPLAARQATEPPVVPKAVTPTAPPQQQSPRPSTPTQPQPQQMPQPQPQPQPRSASPPEAYEKTLPALSTQDSPPAKRQSPNQIGGTPGSSPSRSQPQSVGVLTESTSVAGVRDWLISLDFAEAAALFEENDVDGEAALALEESDLEKLGLKLGIRKKIINAINRARSLPSVAVSPIGRPSQVGRFCSTADEYITYKGILGFPPGYTPNGSCYDVTKRCFNALAAIMPGIVGCLDDCVKAQSSIASSPKAIELINKYGITPDELLAIVLYTYDTSILGDPSKNFYYQLNEILRRRSPEEMAFIHGPLFYLLSALRKLPNFVGTVYRGNNAPDIVKREYMTGRKIFWSAFTSTTVDINVAKNFAGKSGIIFRMKVCTGKDISAFSVIGRENEVLLPPNAGMVVVHEAAFNLSDGCQYVDLIETEGEFRW